MESTGAAESEAGVQGEDSRPILRWAGSKRGAAHKIGAFRKSGSRYIEPFCGSAAVFFAVSPERALLSDINSDLIQFYKCAIADPIGIYRKFVSISRDKETYNSLRLKYNMINCHIEKAATFYYLNRNCFNGLFRTNRSGIFNVPFADKRVARYLREDEFVRSCQSMSSVQFECGDFMEIVSDNVAEGDFVYLDPPYASSKRLPFREYHQASFAVSDLERLSDLLDKIDQKGATFVLSYDDGESIRAIQSRWRSLAYSVRRNISGFSASRRTATEQIITNARDIV